MQGRMACIAAFTAALWVGAMADSSEARAAGYTETKYPIVLAHGLVGFDALFGVVEYWPGIAKALRSDGAKVFVAEVSQFNLVKVRGDQLIAEIEEIVAITGQPKVNIIGHSQGGLDARYVAAKRPDLVASVTTVGSPHYGAELADVVRGILKGGSLAETALVSVAGGLGTLLALLSGTKNPQDPLGALESLSKSGATAFNVTYPQALPTTWCGQGSELVKGVRYFSWSGTRPLTNVFDPSDVLLGLTSLVYKEANDGVVGRCSSHLGTVIRDNYDMNHLDETNLLFGFTHWFSVDPKTLYRQHANRLKNKGL